MTSPRSLADQRQRFQGVLLLALALSLAPLGYEWPLGLCSPALLGARAALATLFALLAAILPRLSARGFSWALVVACSSTGPALAVVASSYGAATPVVVAFVVVLPVTAGLVFPEARLLPWVSGVAAALAVGVLFSGRALSGPFVVLAMVQCLFAAALAAVGGFRLGLLRDRVQLELDSRRRDFTEALAAAAFVRSRDARELLANAVQVLGRQGLRAAVFRLEGAQLVTHVFSVPPGPSPAPAPVGALPLERVPALAEAFARRLPRVERQRAEALDALFGPASGAEGAAPDGLLVPLVVEGAPFGLLALRAPHLDASRAALAELFAHHLEAALENQRALRRAEERLEEVARLQRQLVERERLAAMGSAAGVMAHEVRNPLGAILNATTLLRREPALSPSGAGTLGGMEQQTIRLEALINDLLYLARPLELSLEPLELAHLLQRALTDASSRRGVRFEATLETAPPVLGDSNHLQAVFERLLRTAEAGCREQGRVLVRLGAALGDAAARLEVVYEGVPLPRHQWPHAFEPALAAQLPGPGLALPIVMRVAQLHGGVAEVDADAEGRPRLSVTLPRGR